MKNLQNTIKDLNLVKTKKNIKYLITRFDRSVKNHSDLDILVTNNHFKKMVNGLVDIGYSKQSHDQALGGRIKGAQINLTKKDRIKIDLHKDFTWRSKKYIDLNILWQKDELVDQFLVFINVIFEKTYFDNHDFKYVWKYKNKIFENKNFFEQSKKYKWNKTFLLIKNWKPQNFTLPLFIPVYIVLKSYVEKFNLISLLYYIFFRLRYFLKKQLPYD